MEDDNDSDKENKDPSTSPVLNLTPLSKKRRGKRRKDRGIANFSTLPHTYPLKIDEVGFTFKSFTLVINATNHSMISGINDKFL